MSEPFDSVTAEFGDSRLLPASSDTLGMIPTETQILLKGVPRHEVAEFGQIVDGNPQWIRKHIKLLDFNQLGEEEIEYPYAEIYIGQKVCSRVALSYTVYPDGTIHRKPGFLDGYGWEATDDGKFDIKHEDDWPRTLRPDEVTNLAHHILEISGIEQTHDQNGSIFRAIDLVTESGVLVNDVEVTRFFNGNWAGPQSLPGPIRASDEITIRATERPTVLRALETARRAYYFASVHLSTPLHSRQQTLEIFENGLASYTYKEEDDSADIPRIMDHIKSFMGGGSSSLDNKTADGPITNYFEYFSKDKDRRNSNKAWMAFAEATGLNGATNEQVIVFLASIRMMMPKLRSFEE